MSRIAAAAILSLLLVPPVFGQAWIAPRGETSVALTFQRTEYQGHFLNDGTRVPHGGSHSRTLSLGIEHSLTDRFAISAVLPYVSAANGIDPQPVLGRTGIDDGRFHSAWQDVRLGARYNIISAPVVVTPSLTLRIPMHDYPTVGEAAVGTGLREVQLGIDAGRAFETAGVMLYLDGRYSYTVVEKFRGVSSNRSNLGLDLGYFATPTLLLRAIASWQKTYGALTTDEIFSPGPPYRNPDLSDDLWFGHDGLLRDDHWSAGIGAAYSVTRDVGLSGTFVKQLDGSNSHYGYLYAISVSRTFGRK